MMRTAKYLMVVIVTTFGVYCSAQTQGTGVPEGIVVRGVGDIRAAPNMFEIDLRASGRAELTGDALVKFRDTCSNTMKAFESLGVEDLEIKELGVSVVNGATTAQMQAMMRGVGNTNVKTEVEIGRTLRLTVGGISTLDESKVIELIGKLIDVAKDSGAAIGPTPEEMNMAYRYGRTLHGGLVRFVLVDYEKHEDAAYEAAMRDARRQGERLARLSGVKLGSVSSVQVLAGPTETGSPASGTVMISPAQPNQRNTSKSRLTSGTLDAIAVTVRLQVRFNIE